MKEMLLSGILLHAESGAEGLVDEKTLFRQPIWPEHKAWSAPSSISCPQCSFLSGTVVDVPRLIDTQPPFVIWGS